MTLREALRLTWQFVRLTPTVVYVFVLYVVQLFLKCEECGRRWDCDCPWPEDDE